MIVQPAGQLIKLRTRCDLPAHNRQTAAGGAVNNQALFAIIHSERAHSPPAVDLLHTKQPQRQRTPIVEPRRLDADVTEGRNFHRHSVLFRAVTARRG